jgi:hypothetical protein
VVCERDSDLAARFEHKELNFFASELLQAPALLRLKGVSFLGVLSPRYSNTVKSPPVVRRRISGMRLPSDGSRFSHSIGVADLALRICREVGFSETLQKYVVAWGLFHDLGNWPLSHTAQRAFESVQKVDVKTLRRWMIVDDERAPKKYHSAKFLEAFGVDPYRLAAFFMNEPDRELAPLHILTKSRLTPDMLEGIWRAGRSLGVVVPDPYYFQFAFSQDLFSDLRLRQSHSDGALDFWRAKKEIYRAFFGAKSVVLWESAWSLAIQNDLASRQLSLLECLELDESKLVARVLERGIHQVKKQHRWKPPLRQRIIRPIPIEPVVASLDNFFLEEPITPGV